MNVPQKGQHLVSLAASNIERWKTEPRRLPGLLKAANAVKHVCEKKVGDEGTAGRQRPT